MSIFSKLPEVAHFSSVPAQMIDIAYRDMPKNRLGRFMSFLKIRAMYCFLFLPLVCVDLVTSFLLGVRYAYGSFFTSDELQEKRLAQQKKYTSLFSKNFYALLASFLGFISPKLVAFYFTPEQTKKNTMKAGGNLYETEAEIKAPQAIEELQQIIKDAASSGKKIMPVGAGRSQGKQFLPAGKNGVVIDLKNFNRIEIKSNKKVAIVGAGVRWGELQQEVNKHNLALKVMQASNVFSVGGSIGTNIHGWDHISGVLSNTVLSIDIINAQGNLEKLTPEDDLFHKITGGLGLYGVVVSAKIQLADNDLLKEVGTEVSPQQYAEHFRTNVQNDEKIQMHLYRLSLDPNNLLGSGVSVDYVKEENSQPAITPNLKMESPAGTRFDRVMINIARISGFARKKYWEAERKRLLANKSEATTRNEIMHPPINAMFNPSVSESEWLQEYFLPEDKLEDFLKELGQILMQNQVPLINASVRFVKQHNKSPLSYAHDGDRFAVVLCFNQSLDEQSLITAKKWLRQSQHLATEKGGTYYLPYQHVSSPDDFTKAYPRAKEAFEAKKAVDPNELFVSGMYEKYLSPHAQINHFKVMMATNETKKRFSGFLRNVLHRVDSDQLFVLLEDIMQYNDSHEEIYSELCHRLPEIMPNLINDFGHILDSLSAIKNDLAAQAKELLPDDLQQINGLVEIGYPGRFVEGFQNNYKVTGKIVAVYEGKALSDYIQTGFPRPYDQFEKLDYNKPNLKNLADNSADVITCYVGLHHFPEDELDKFLADVRRVLRKGGHFLIVDHDVINEESLSMAHMAHSIFNAVTGASIEEEMNETRNFQPISYWKQQLEKFGLGYAIEDPDVEIIRHEDPSRNRMVSFKNNKISLVKTESATPKADKSSEELKDWRRAQPTLAGNSRHIVFANHRGKPISSDTSKLESSAGMKL